MTAPPAGASPADIRRRREFARTHIADARGRGDIPTYGTPGWHRLPYDSPLRWAAVLIAAECWARDGDNLPARLAQDLAQESSVDAQRNAEGFADLASRIRVLARTPTHAALQHRRGETTDQQLQAHDRANAAFVAGATDTPPRLAKRGAA